MKMEAHRRATSCAPNLLTVCATSVRMAYRMLAQHVVEMRVERWGAFIADASGVDVAEVDNVHMHSMYASPAGSYMHGSE
jgi:hypothetical protein